MIIRWPWSKRFKQETMVEIGGQEMTESQFNAARFPLLETLAEQERQASFDALVPPMERQAVYQPTSQEEIQQIFEEERQFMERLRNLSVVDPLLFIRIK